MENKSFHTRKIDENITLAHTNPVVTIETIGSFREGEFLQPSFRLQASKPTPSILEGLAAGL